MDFDTLWPNKWFIFGAFFLLFFSCISGSAWSQVSFLDAQIGGKPIYFGVFGCTGVSQPTLGYNISQAVGPIDPRIDGYIGSAWFSTLEMVLIMHLLIMLLLFLTWALIFWRLDAGKLKTIRNIAFGLAAIATFPLFLFDVGFFVTLRNNLRSVGVSADLGNANWITLGAVLAIFIEPCWILLEPKLPDAFQRRPPEMNGLGSLGLPGPAPALPPMPPRAPPLMPPLPPPGPGGSFTNFDD